MVKNLIIVVLGAALAAFVFLYAQKPTPQQPNNESAAPPHELCAQVITSALDPETGVIVEFPTPCDVPTGWLVVENDVPDLDLEVQ